MGNVIRGGREKSVKPKQTLYTVRAAGVFKAKANEAKRKSISTADQIRRKDTSGITKLGKLATVDEQNSEDDQEREVMRFVHSVNIGDDRRIFTVNDTSVAWTALLESANREKRASIAQPEIKAGRLGLFKSITDAVRFIRRSSSVKVQNTTPNEVLSYNEEYRPTWERHCHICHRSSTENSPMNPCRICSRIYHTNCMERRGYLSQDSSVETLKLAKTDIGWSCFDCENLFKLLSDKEKSDVMETFDRIDTDKDSLINKEEYLAYQKDYYLKLLGMEMPQYRVTLEEAIFADMNRNNTGLIDWWEYLIPMCVRKLSERKKSNLVSCLTKRELNKLRELFKQYDQDGYGEISQYSSRMAFKYWYLSLINLRHEQVPVWDWLGTDYISEPGHEGALLSNRAKKVKWGDFVRNHALYILAARPNTGSMRPYVPRIGFYRTENNDEEDEY